MPPRPWHGYMMRGFPPWLFSPTSRQLLVPSFFICGGKGGGGRGKERGEKQGREKKGEERGKRGEEGRRERKKRRGRSEEKGGESSEEQGEDPPRIRLSRALGYRCANTIPARRVRVPGPFQDTRHARAIASGTRAKGKPPGLSFRK